MLGPSPGIAKTRLRARETAHRLTSQLSNAFRRVDIWIPVTIAAAIPVVVVYARPLHTAPNYDEDVYLATMRELHHGVPIGSVFLSQPPGFGWLLHAIGETTSSLDTVRWIMIALSLVGCAAAWTLGRRAAGPIGGAVAAATLAVSPVWVVLAARLEAEVPSTALAIVALALAGPYPLLAGIAFALAVSMKLLAVSAVVPLVLLARRRLAALAIGAAVTTAAIAVSVAGHLHDVWEQAFAFHLDARKIPGGSTSSNFHRVADFLSPHTPFALIVAAAVLIAVVDAFRRRRVVWELWTWPVAAGVVLVAQHPLQDHHMEILAAAWAVPAGVTLAGAIGRLRRRNRLIAAATLAVLVTAGLYQQWGEVTPVPEPADVSAAVGRLRTLEPRDSLVASDLQIVPYLAGDLEPPSLVDVSDVRMESGNLTKDALLHDSTGARAFVVGRSLSANTAVLDALAHRYRRRITVGTITIFVDPRP